MSAGLWRLIIHSAQLVDSEPELSLLIENASDRPQELRIGLYETMAQCDPLLAVDQVQPTGDNFPVHGELNASFAYQPLLREVDVYWSPIWEWRLRRNWGRKYKKRHGRDLD